MPNPLENVTAKVVKKTAAVAARIEGLKGVFVTLAEQHHELGSLLERLEATSDFTHRVDLWRDIRRELISHEQGELAVIYPALDATDEAREIAQTHSTDTGELERQVSNVDHTPVQSDEWEAALGVLIAKVREHVELEENELFPRAQRALGEDASRQLEEPFRVAKEAAKSRFA
jgi:hypothetical protein